MSVLKKYFNKKVDWCSPAQVDYERVVNHDEDSNEFISFVPVDYKKLVMSNGTVADWKLDTLLKAGINPNFPIRTGIATRIEGLSEVDKAAAYLDEVLTETKTDE